MKINFSSSEIALIIINLIPLVGLLFLHWSLFSLLMIYWIETGVIGFYTVLKMRKVSVIHTPTDINHKISKNEKPTIIWFGGIKKSTISEENAVKLMKTMMIPFFVIMFSFTMFVHFMFILAIGLIIDFPSSSFNAFNFLISTIIFIVTIISLFISHGVSYKINYIGNKEYKRTTLVQLFFQPYIRSFLIHFVIIISFFLFLFLNLPRLVSLIFIPVKIILDIQAHRKEHRFNVSAR